MTDAHGAASPFGTPPDRLLTPTVTIPGILLFSLPVGKGYFPWPIDRIRRRGEPPPETTPPLECHFAELSSPVEPGGRKVHVNRKFT